MLIKGSISLLRHFAGKHHLYTQNSSFNGIVRWKFVVVSLSIKSPSVIQLEKNPELFRM